MKRKIVRKFVGSDALMLETSEVLHAMFVQRLSSFETFDTALNNAFATEWLDAIKAARDTSMDTTVLSTQLHETSNMKKSMQNAVIATTDLLHFAQKAFKVKGEIIAAFGKGKGLAHARQSQPRMAEFMDLLVDMVTRYTTELTAAGASAQVLGAVATARNELKAANLTQNTAIKDRPSATHQRIEAMNHAFDFGKTVAKAAKSVFRNQPEIASGFRFKANYKRKKKEPKIETEDGK